MTGSLVEAVIDLGALDANIAHLRRAVAPAELMVVVKADAYGHGRVRVAQQAIESGIRAIGALDLDTALELRAAGIGDEVAVLSWLYPPGQDFADAIAAHVDLGVSSIPELTAITDAARELSGTAGFVPPRLHLKLDTGLHRNGATTDDWPALVAGAVEAERAGLVRTFAAWTHIAEASEDEDTIALERFLDGVSVARDLGATIDVRHLAASSAGLRREDVRLDLVRMGGHCWGIPSFDGVTPAEIGLTPVMTLRAQVLAVRETGDDRAEAYVSAGYGDGVPRNVAGSCAVAVRGVQHPIVRVERDHLVIAVAPGAELGQGDAAVLFGAGAEGEQTVRQWGDLSGTLGDEITTRIAARVPRRYLEA
ncbi:alanine racemase [Gryllotalpicola protaetiae]|uniref:Alanine racemase n=1 Tax=Gryllotalpicola protaetiae TaxID=2419771 RepID=A0A387BR13_9MICO|nr:alanine racemase [Gryllotalpicola protaetiae]AYG05012.1 alanine racemase [Gryllotalpicola protaetiae]